VALFVITYAYARALKLSRSGSALVAISFALCGFQAAHIGHEPFNQLMPYLPLCLLLAERYVTTRRPLWLASLAIAWGIQVTIGHFQIQMWTAGLVLLLGIWRTWALGLSRNIAFSRIAGLGAGLCWGLLIAFVQFRLTWELTAVSGFVRPAHLLAA